MFDVRVEIFSDLSARPLETIKVPVHVASHPLRAWVI
jgi:hypothetical protein